VAALIIYDNYSSVNYWDLQYESIDSKWYNSEISNKTVLTKSAMTPFTGRINNKSYKGSFVEGKKHGLHKEYSSGNLIKKGKYNYGIPIGNHKEWHSNGQLRSDINYNNGLRVGLSKAWDYDGHLFRIDYNEGDILKYIEDYLKSPKYNFEKSYKEDTPETSYKFVLAKFDDDYFYGVMVNNYINTEGYSPSESVLFEIGDIKFRASIISESNQMKLEGFWRMASRNKEGMNLNVSNPFTLDEPPQYGLTIILKNEFDQRFYYKSIPEY